MTRSVLKRSNLGSLSKLLRIILRSRTQEKVLVAFPSTATNHTAVCVPFATQRSTPPSISIAFCVLFYSSLSSFCGGGQRERAKDSDKAKSLESRQASSTIIMSSGASETDGIATAAGGGAGGGAGAGATVTPPPVPTDAEREVAKQAASAAINGGGAGGGAGAGATATGGDAENNGSDSGDAMSDSTEEEEEYLGPVAEADAPDEARAAKVNTTTCG